MRHLALSSILAITTLTAPALAAPAQYELDPTHTTVMFTIDHVGYAATIGVFGEVAGTFTYDMDTQDLSNVQVAIAADSVNTFLEARDGHVRKRDFLGSHHSWPNAASDAGCDPKQGRSLSFWAQTHGVGSLTYGQDQPQ